MGFIRRIRLLVPIYGKHISNDLQNFYSLIFWMNRPSGSGFLSRDCRSSLLPRRTASNGRGRSEVGTIWTSKMKRKMFYLYNTLSVNIAKFVKLRFVFRVYFFYLLSNSKVRTLLVLFLDIFIFELRLYEWLYHVKWWYSCEIIVFRLKIEISLKKKKANVQL